MKENKGYTKVELMPTGEGVLYDKVLVNNLTDAVRDEYNVPDLGDIITLQGREFEVTMTKTKFDLDTKDTILQIQLKKIC